MINSPTALGPIDLPDDFSVQCLADIQPHEGILLHTTVVMLRKNNFGVIFGPSDSCGKVSIQKQTILDKMYGDRKLFPMDYDGLPYFSGDLILEPMGRQEIESAIKAYDIFKSVNQYPSDYLDRLEAAWKTIYQASFRRLEVKIDVPLPVQSPPPYREVRIATRSIIVC